MQGKGGKTYRALFSSLLLCLLNLLAQGDVGGDLFLEILLISSVREVDRSLAKEFERCARVGERTKSRKDKDILQASRPGTNITEESFEIGTVKHSVLLFFDSRVLFGDSRCAIRPHVVCPVPPVEAEISDSDLFLPL